MLASFLLIFRTPDKKIVGSHPRRNAKSHNSQRVQSEGPRKSYDRKTDGNADQRAGPLQQRIHRVGFVGLYQLADDVFSGFLFDDLAFQPVVQVLPDQLEDKGRDQVNDQYNRADIDQFENKFSVNQWLLLVLRIGDDGGQ